MSYYRTLTTDQIATLKHAYDQVIQQEDSQFVATNTIQDLPPQELNLVVDYIGYLIFRALLLKQKYHNHTGNILEYMAAYRIADYSLAAFIQSVGLESIKNQNANRMVERFLKSDDL